MAFPQPTQEEVKELQDDNENLKDQLSDSRIWVRDEKARNELLNASMIVIAKEKETEMLRSQIDLLTKLNR